MLISGAMKMLRFPIVSRSQNLALPWRRTGRAARLGAPELAAMAWSLVAVWQARRRQRIALQDLADWQLRDIGIDRETARTEARKPFWQA